MKILLIGSALALAAGTPGQRAAHALRQTLECYGSVSHLTIDVWGSEWESRSRMPAGDRLMASKRPRKGEAVRPFLSLPRADHVTPVTVGEVNRQITETLVQEPWMNRSRRMRIVDFVWQTRPDLIVITESLLADLVEMPRFAGMRIVLYDTGFGSWAGQASLGVLNSEHAMWMRQLAGVFSKRATTRPQLFDRMLGCAGASEPERAVLQPIQIEPNELFFSKANNLVVPSTGIAWFDRQILRQVDEFLQHCIAQALDLPTVILIGFDHSLVRDIPNAEIHSGWQKLQNSVGAARCLFLPVLTPALAQLALAALGVGTPVLTTRRAAALYGLVRQPGVFTELSASMPLAILQLLDEEVIGEDGHRAIASAAKGLVGEEARARLVAQLLQAEGAAENLKPLRAIEALPFKPRRVPPSSAAPVVFYNPATRMLLVRLQLRVSAEIDEIGLLDFAGNELNRLAPPTAPTRGPSLTMEGGVVTELADLSGGIVIELNDSLGLVASHRIAVEDFETLCAEIALAHIDGGMLRGAFWALDSAEPSRWTVGFAPHQTSANLLAARPMPEIGARAIPFAIPLPATITSTSECLLRRGEVGTSLQSFETPPQRAHRETRNSLSTDVRPSGAVPSLKGIHAGKRAWIIGNGPSVRLEDLAAIPKDDVTFCFNRFYLSYDEHPLRETYVVSADTLMVQDFGQEMIDRSSGLPLFCMSPVRLPQLHGDYVLLRPGDHYLTLFSQEPEKFVSVGGSSVFVALQMAWYMGIRDVVLYGMDYSFVVKMQRDPRFPFPVSFEEGNHFIKSYRGAKPWCPPTWRDISAGFINARVAFELSGGRVLNATRGGRLQTFARVDFDDIRERPVGG